MIVRNEWVPFRQYRELGLEIDALTRPSTVVPPLRPDDLAIKLTNYSGTGPSVRYRVERRVPRRRPHDWGGFEFNLEDVESWMAWAASEMVRSAGPPASADP